MITKWLQATDDYEMFQLQVINHLLIYQIIASFNYDSFETIFLKIQKEKIVDEHKKKILHILNLPVEDKCGTLIKVLYAHSLKVMSTHWKHKILWFKLKCYGPKTSLRQRVKAAHQQLFLHSK